ncbi:hypothetical protein LOTGIDRAFT_138941 [Lottia gigantea]|uniref:ADAM10 endopeptidase n=1 Tax=Lottia gigantea TaxID=225164 RepID=V4CI89_LOTGI|nr:hypothetical protein LOTGIDRAFT_138941 [Lottia gigantea]ESP01850.1 hypothetical protein LOTGIDRAFT_138941 [Lottia gigantea]
MEISFSEFHKLDDYIHHYEPLNYDTKQFHANHERVKRSIEPHLYLKFKAFDRDFNIKLKQDKTIFSDTHRHKNEDGKTESYIDTSFIYHGHLTGKPYVPTSYAHMAVINGTARGFIRIPGDAIYHIDPAEIYLKNPEFHSVIYSEKHMDLDPYQFGPISACQIWAILYMSEFVLIFALYEASNIYARESNEQDSEKYHRTRRDNLGIKNTCNLYLRSDPMLWNHTDERTKEEIIAFFSSHVAAINEIYSRTVFETYDRNIQWSGVNFVVQRTSIMTNTGQKCNTAAQTAYCNSNIDVSNFLNLNSLDNHDDFCLAYVFTYRDFNQGTLGLAWVGAATRAAGGICEKYKKYPENDIEVGKSLNTGIVTIVNYGKKVPSRVSHLTFAHEVGHNFGSPHDTGVECAPYGTSDPQAAMGNYIMFSSATMGDKDNNDNFSKCSKDNITRVLDAVINKNNGKVNCFQSSTTAFCGNGLVEEGEECDCGYVSDCTDKCCYAKNSEGKECTRRPNKICSPTAGPCCSVECEFLPKSEVCRPSDSCTKESLFTGGSSSCPEPGRQPNKTFCNDKTQVCLEGECRGSVCLRIDWGECFLTSTEGDNGPSKEELCFIACMILVDCVLANTTKPQKVFLRSYLFLGSPCDNFRGYCDVFHRCRGVDAEGPLARLKNLIFDPKNLQTIKDWIEENWWAVLLMAIGLVVVMGVFIKVCAVHTPSSNPRKAAARKLTLPRRGQHSQPPPPGGNKQNRRNPQGNFSVSKYELHLDI